MLINQSKYAVERFSKNDESKWGLTEEKGESEILKLTSLNLAIAFRVIYNKNPIITESIRRKKLCPP